LNSLLNRFTTTQIVLIAVAIVLGLAGIWGLAHWTAAPGTEVNVAWVSYTKNASAPDIQNQKNESPALASELKPAVQNDDPEALKRQIVELQEQLQEAYEIQSRQQIETLDPQSELPNLISELESDEAAIQEQAIQGLFIVRNPVSYQALRSYFRSRVGEAGFLVSSYSRDDWFDLLFELNEMESTRLAAEIVGSEEISEDVRRAARSALMFDTQSSDAIEVAIGVFQQLALTSKNTLIRTNAKKDLQWLIERRERTESRQ